jgi:hypothetical protein
VFGEKEATEKVCKLVKKHFKGRAGPRGTPEQSVKLVCKVAFVVFIDKEATTEVRNTIKEHFMEVPNCEATGYCWNNIKQVMAKETPAEVCKLIKEKISVLKLIKEHFKKVPKPTPEEIESMKLMCKVAFVGVIEKEVNKNQFNEKEATEEVCQLIK